MADSIIGFTVERSMDNINWTTLTVPDLPGNQFSYTDPSPPATAYYRVTGHTQLGFTIPYNIIHTTAPSNGNFSWQVPIQGTTVVDLTDIGGIAVDANNNTIIAGSFSGTVNFGGITKTSAGGWDAFVAKYNLNGTLQWVNQYGNEFDQFASSVAIDSQGNILVGGYFAGAMNVDGTILTEVPTPSFFYAQFDIFVIKLTTAGAKIWAKSFGGGGAESCYGIAVDSQDNVFITGNYTIPANTTQLDFGGTAPLGGPLANQCPQDFYLAKFRSDGTFIWRIHHGCNDGSFSFVVYANSIAVDASGDAIVAGQISGGSIDLGSGTKAGHGGSDIFVAKYSGVNGNCIWGRVIGGTGSDVANAVAVNAVKDVFLTGGFINTIDWGNGHVITTPKASTGVFIARLGAIDGSTNFARGYGANSDLTQDIGRAISIDSSQNILVTGTVQGSFIDWGGGPKFSDGTLNIFIAKLDQNSGYIWDKRIKTGATSNYGKAIRADSLNNVLVSGFFAGKINFGGADINATSDHCGFLVKFGP